MRALTLILILLLTVVAPAIAADVTYPVTVADEYQPALADHAKTVNLLRSRAAKGATPQIALTPQQVLQQIVDVQLSNLDAQFLAGEATKPWAEKSPRAKRRHCVELQIQPTDCPK